MTSFPPRLDMSLLDDLWAAFLMFERADSADFATAAETYEVIGAAACRQMPAAISLP